jgi:hypothetical protein
MAYIYLCTGAFLYVPYSTLLTSRKKAFFRKKCIYKFGHRTVSFNHKRFDKSSQCWLAVTPPASQLCNYALGAPYDTPLHSVKVTHFFEPQMALAYWLDAISKGPKNARFPGSNPLPLALVMDLHASKTFHGAV